LDQLIHVKLDRFCMPMGHRLDGVDDSVRSDPHEWRWTMRLRSAVAPAVSALVAAEFHPYGYLP
jgi:hypothetical protein